MSYSLKNKIKTVLYLIDNIRPKHTRTRTMLIIVEILIRLIYFRYALMTMWSINLNKLKWNQNITRSFLSKYFILQSCCFVSIKENIKPRALNFCNDSILVVYNNKKQISRSWHFSRPYILTINEPESFYVYLTPSLKIKKVKHIHPVL